MTIDPDVTADNVVFADLVADINDLLAGTELAGQLVAVDVDGRLGLAPTAVEPDIFLSVVFASVLVSGALHLETGQTTSSTEN